MSRLRTKGRLNGARPWADEHKRETRARDPQVKLLYVRLNLTIAGPAPRPISRHTGSKRSADHAGQPGGHHLRLTVWSVSTGFPLLRSTRPASPTLSARSA